MFFIIANSNKVFHDDSLEKMGGGGKLSSFNGSLITKLRYGIAMLVQK